MNTLKIKIYQGCFAVISLFAFSQHAISQQAAGLYYDNYAGIHSVIYNPAAPTHGRLAWDVNLASVNAYAQNSYSYVMNSSLWQLRGQLDSLMIISDDEQIVPPEATGVNFFDESRNKRAIAKVDIMGPSAWVNFHPVAVGVYTRFRIESHTPSIPAVLGYQQYQELAFGELSQIPKIQSAGAAWSEYGVNLSSNQLWYDETFSLGLSVKYLRVHEAYNIYTPEGVQLQKDNNTVSFADSRAVASYTAGVGMNSLQRQHRGNGWALDIGLSKTWDRGKIGAALLDIGRMNVKNDAQMHNIVVNDLLSLNVDDINNQSNLSELITLIDQNSADSTLAADRFTLGTPAKLVVNVDYQLARRIFVNGSLVNNLAMNDEAIHAENNVTIAPRYETRWLSVAAPVSISGTRELRVGLGARLGFFTIGSDDILSWFNQSEFNGSSIYAAVKINPWNNNTKGKNVKCPKIKRSPFDSANPIKGAKRMRSSS